MKSKETIMVVEPSPSFQNLEETVDFEHVEEQEDIGSVATRDEKGEKPSPTKKPVQQQQDAQPQQLQRKNSSSQVAQQQTIKHRNSSKKKALSGQVAARLEQAVAQGSSKPVNRSADLVPLTHEFDKLKRRLRALITAAKQYHECMGRMYRARMEVRDFEFIRSTLRVCGL
jgi:hypothetical protein